MKKINKYYFSLLLIFLAAGFSTCSYARIFKKNAKSLNQTSAIIVEKPVSVKEKRTFFSLKRKRKPNKTMPNTLTTIRSFQESMTDAEKKDVKYVLTSCANLSTFSLAMAQTEIKSALFRIQEIHPLVLLEEIFKDSLLTEDFLKIRSRGWIWNTFHSKLKESLTLVAEKGLLSKDVIKSFSKNLDLEESTIISLLESKRWDDFLEVLIKE